MISKMGKKNHKIFSQLLILLAIVFSMAGCAEAGTDTSKINAAGNSKAETTVSSEETLTSKKQNTDDEKQKKSDTEQKQSDNSETAKTATESSAVSLKDIPKYSGKAYVAVNNNVPFFTAKDMTTKAFENYSALDSQGRCGVAYANVCKELMPTEKRGSIGQVKPSGWHTVKYDCVDGKYLYNRCHLIGYQLTAENANEKNLITGTRYLNIEGMLPFENMVTDYVKETNNHVLYRVTPIFDGSNLVASGVLMEAKSVEDDGKGILYNVYCYNVQPGVTIDYNTGNSNLNGQAPQNSTASSSTKKSTTSNKVYVAPSKPSGSKTTQSNSSNSSQSGQASQEKVYITNTGKKYHRAGCSSLKKSSHEISKQEAIDEGYEPCSKCNP